MAEKETVDKAERKPRTSKRNEPLQIQEVVPEFRKISLELSTKDGNGELRYASWSEVWENVLDICPTAAYRVKTWPVYDEAGRETGERFFTYEENVGGFVSTEVTIAGQTHRMHLPILNEWNYPMLKDRTYKVSVNGRTISVPPFMSADVNRAIMRCLVKNLAMFGLGLYVYRDKEVPDLEEAEKNGIPVQPVVELGVPAAEPLKADSPAENRTAGILGHATAAEPIEGLEPPVVIPMTLDEACAYVMPLGKKKGMTIQEIIDASKSIEEVEDYFSKVANYAGGQTAEAANTILSAIIRGELSMKPAE